MFMGTETRPSVCVGLKCTVDFACTALRNLTLSCGLDKGDDVGLRLNTWLPDPASENSCYKLKNAKQSPILVRTLLT